MTRPVIDTKTGPREMTDAEYKNLLASGWVENPPQPFLPGETITRELTPEEIATLPEPFEPLPE